MPQKRIIRYVGLAPEATYNPTTPPDARFHVDISSAGLDSPTDTQMTYESSISRGTRIHRPGFYAPEGDLSYAFDIQTIGWMLRFVLGGYKFTAGAVGPPAVLPTHEIYGVEDVFLPTFTARVGKDVFEHVFTGCVGSSLSIEVEDEFAVATMEVMAAKDAKAPLKTVPELLLPDQYPLAFHEVTATVAGTDYSPKIRSLTLNIDNSTDSERGRGLGSRHPYRMPSQAREVTLEMSMFHEDTAELERFWGASNGPSGTGSAEFPLIVNFNAGADGSMALRFPRTVYTEVQQQPSGRDEIDLSVSARCYIDNVTLADTSTVVSTEVLATLRNAETDMSVVV